MKYIRQISLILGFSFLGELCSALIPFSLPAAIWGMVLLVAALLLKLVRWEWIQETGDFLTGMLPLLFVVPVVGLLDHWQSIAPALGGVLAIIALSTVLTFGAAGRITRWLMGKEDADAPQ